MRRPRPGRRAREGPRRRQLTTGGAGAPPSAASVLGYLGVAPTVPILGSGGNTTSFGFLAGLGLEYITNEAGPDEGLKPAAFVSAVVQVAQAAPQVSTSGRAIFGTHAGD